MTDVKLIIITMSGGLALFLYGMKMLSEGLQLAFGDRLRVLLERLTGNKMKGVGVGAVFTAIIQSSSITTVTLVGLINAGLITLSQSVPVIMGANIGTTMTAQLIAFKIGKFALPIIALGFFIYATGRRPASKYAGQVILGFGILFLGMNLMSSEAKMLTQDPRITDMMSRMGQNPLMGILAGTLFTAVVQSSSATTGLVISLAMTGNGLLSLNSAIALILGANIGTCITVILAAMGSSLSSRRAAAAHVLFNIIGVLLFFPILGIFSNLVTQTSANLPRQIANAHLFFNLSCTLILIPFTDLLVKLVIRILPGREIHMEKGVKYLDEHTLRTPSVALKLAEMETTRVAGITLSMVQASRKALFDENPTQVDVVRESEAVVDELKSRISKFLTRIDKRLLTNRQKANHAVLSHAINDLERISDHANNICELATVRISRKIKFSPEAFEELSGVFQKAEDSLITIETLITEGDENLVSQVLQIESDVDDIVSQLERRHMDRLEENQCTAEAGPIYIDVLRNLERITDHTHNIACAKSFGF